MSPCASLEQLRVAHSYNSSSVSSAKDDSSINRFKSKFIAAVRAVQATLRFERIFGSRVGSNEGEIQDQNKKPSARLLTCLALDSVFEHGPLVSCAQRP